MTTAPDTKPERNFVTGTVPWLVAAGFLVVYLLTLNHWLVLGSRTIPPYAGNPLETVARVSGWTWQPALTEPLYWLLTYPFTFLPARLIPIGLNLFAALCAALSLALLARSVAILPHNRTESQRQAEKNPKAILQTRINWMPPLIAVLVCGLQLSFWENATAASGEMLNLLLFAYVTRCLLERRIDHRDGWLIRATFVFALGMANNWGMIGYAPLFLLALLWMKRLRFFEPSFLLAITLAGAAGLLLYLLLPVVAALGKTVDLSVWQALKLNLSSQKALLLGITFNKYVLFLGDQPLWVLALPTLLPLLLMSIRWPSYFGDPSPLGVALATLVFHFFHALLFGVCLWVMLDPSFSPRNMMSGTPLLSLYYLAALSVGYLAGYFTLVFGYSPEKPDRNNFNLPPLINNLIYIVTWALVIITPAALIYRNYPTITALNGSITDKSRTAFREFGEVSVLTLPKEGCILLSDDPRRLTFAHAILTERGEASKYLFVDTQSLNWPQYHAVLDRDPSHRWKNFLPAGANGQVDPGSLIQILYTLSLSNSVYYLHPSFGYYFEAFWMEPSGLAYRLHSYTTNSFLRPLQPKTALTYNEGFWKKADESVLSHLIDTYPQAARKPQNFADLLLRKAKVESRAHPDLAALGAFYSRSRNWWAVEVQRAGLWKEAHGHLEQALNLNEQNLVARANLDFNEQHQAGKTEFGEFAESFEDQFGRSWTQLMNDDGPFDEPRFCFEQGRLCVRGNLLRQAAEQFQRSRELAPSNLAARLWLGQVYVLARWPNAALDVIKSVHADSAELKVSKTNTLELMSIEAGAWLVKGDSQKAADVVNAALHQNPKDEELLGAAMQLYMNYRQYTNALELIDQQLKLHPENAGALVNKGFALVQTAQYKQAIPPLTRAMATETNTTSELYDSALFNRAIAYLQDGQLEQAQRDYDSLLKKHPSAFKLYFGLAEIAYRKKDTNAALQQYRSYLANAPTNGPEADFVRGRIRELKGGRP